MSGLFSSLNSSVKALTAHSRAIEITGKNLANVNNADYARQRVLYGDRGTVVTATGAESLGLEALGVTQIRDALLDQQVCREVALKSSYLAEQSGYQRAQAGLGQSIDRSSATTGVGSNAGTGLAASLDDFFNSFQSFASRPTDDGERETLLQKAAILTDRFQLADTRLAQVQSDLNSAAAIDVAEVNRRLTAIAELNAQIGRFEVNAPGSAVDLRDQRQAQIEALSAKLPVEVRNSSNGEVQIVAKDTNGSDTLLVDLTAVTGKIAFDGTRITAGDAAVQLDPSSGSIKGAIAARDGAVQTLRNDLDQLARQLVTSVNSAYNPTQRTGDFFKSNGTSAGSISVVNTVTASTLKANDSGVAGDNSIALAVAQLADHQFSTADGDHIDGTFSSHFSNSVSKLGQALSSANSRVDDQSNIEQLVRTQRDGVSGVSLDEEMADLMKYQRAFQASSRVFTVMDDLLDVVVNRLSR